MAFKVKSTTKKKQEAFIQGWMKYFGNVSEACRVAGIARQTYYNWLRKDPEFVEKLEEIDTKEMYLDYLEGVLMRQVITEPRLLMYALDHHGQSRGYGKRFEKTNPKDLPEYEDAKVIVINEIIENEDGTQTVRNQRQSLPETSGDDKAPEQP